VMVIERVFVGNKKNMIDETREESTIMHLSSYNEIGFLSFSNVFLQPEMVHQLHFFIFYFFGA
jgi:hypothetical protein